MFGLFILSDDLSILSIKDNLENASKCCVVTHNDTLIELLSSTAISRSEPLPKKPNIPQWKYNLKHQRPDDALPVAA
jgi:hypothetical protein